MLRSESGSTPASAVVAIVLLMVLTMGTIQVALLLLARDAVTAATHEAARAAAELGGDPATAAGIAHRTFRAVAGGLVQEPRVSVRYGRSIATPVVTVTLTGRLVVPGPVPLSLGIERRAVALRETVP